MKYTYIIDSKVLNIYVQNRLLCNYNDRKSHQRHNDSLVAVVDWERDGTPPTSHYDSLVVVKAGVVNPGEEEATNKSL